MSDKSAYSPAAIRRGAYLRKARKERGFTQKSLGKLIHRNHMTIYRIEKGRVGEIDEVTRWMLQMALDVRFPRLREWK